MHQSSTLYIGMEVHKASIAVAYVAKDHGAELDFCPYVRDQGSNLK